MQKSQLKGLFTFAKVAVSIVLLYYVIQQLNWDFVLKQWRKADITFIVLGVLSFLLSQVISTFRMQKYLRVIGVGITNVNALKIYLLGMFFNLFVPGGIGGDAYKIIAIRRYFDISYKSIAKAIFLDRLIGLVAIVLLILFGVQFLDIEKLEDYKTYILILSVLATVLLPLFISILFKKFRKAIVPTLGLSFLIQFFQIATISCGMLALGLNVDYLLYAVIFLISSILSIVSFAGIGLRETFFYYAALYADVNPDISATLAIFFSVVTIVISFFGIIYSFNKIKLK